MEKIKIKRHKNKIKNTELIWDKQSRKEITERIVKLKDEQLGALLKIIIDFESKYIENIIKDIKKYKKTSVNLDTLITEAPSKDELLWWIEFFEKHNK